LHRAGFDRVFNLSGGLGAWTGAGLPVTTKG
jgi:rhodanese-related sulfurtransferase